MQLECRTAEAPWKEGEKRFSLRKEGIYLVNLQNQKNKYIELESEKFSG